MERSIVSKNRFWWGITLALFLFIVGPIIFFDGNTSFDYGEIHWFEAIALGSKDAEKLRSLSDLHASRARKANNIIEVANAFYYRIHIEEKEMALAYSDSIILITEGSDNIYYPTMGYILRGNLHYESGNFQKALDNYLKAYDLAFEKNNKDHQREISTAIAAIRNASGQHSAAADLYRRSLNLLRERDEYLITHYEDYMKLLYNLASTHLRMSQLDSAQYYVGEGIKTASITGSPLDFREFVLLGSEIDFFEKDYEKAKDTINKYIDGLAGGSKARSLYYLGKINKVYKNHDLATQYFRRVDSVISITGVQFDGMRDVYQQLIFHSRPEDSSKNQINYLKKFIYHDSLLVSQQEGLWNRALVAFDIPFLKLQKEIAEEQLRIRGNVVIGLGLLAFVALSSGIYLYLRNRIMRKRSEDLLEGDQIVKPVHEPGRTHPPTVPPEASEDILKKLEEFEKSSLYLAKDLDLPSMAQKLETNTAYLSATINHYKEKSFPSYMKGLKISYAIKRLKEEPELLKYTYGGLADIFGFKSGKSFSKAFRAKTGVYPSKFLNKLKTFGNKPHL